MNTIRFFIFFLPMMFIFSGCSIGTLKLYSGPDLPKNELAIVTNTNFQIRVVKLDSQKIALGSWMSRSESALENAEILPGTHKFTAYSLSAPIAVLEANLKASHEYQFDTGWHLIPKEDVIQGRPHNSVKLDKCRIEITPNFSPVAACEEWKDFSGNWNIINTYVDRNGSLAIYLPFLYEVINKKIVPVSNVVGLEFY